MKILIVLALLASSTMGALVLPRLPLEVLMRGGWPLIDTQIVGGTQTTAGEFPYQITLQRLSLGTWSHSCGGSVYNVNYILNAAHCVSGVNINNLRVVAGEYSLSQVSGNEQTRTLSAITSHPNYNSATSANDIALLHVSTPLTLNTWVAAVTIPAQGTQTAAGVNCVVTGWGTTSSGGSTIPDIMRKVTVPTVSDATCRASYGVNDITDSMLCAGFAAGGADSCQGDSGGPLVIQGTRTQVGVVSWGYGCADAGYYGVYTEVSYFTSWIQGIAGL